VQRSSDTIGTIAAALARAQAELVNPEKSLVAIIRSDGPRGVEQTFRYAPLSLQFKQLEANRRNVPARRTRHSRLAPAQLRFSRWSESLVTGDSVRLG